MRQRIDGLLLVFFVSGMAGLVYESVWSHYVKLFLGHASYAQTLVLVVFIGGLALGSWLCARAAGRIRNPLRLYALIEGAIGLVALAFHGVFLGVTEWAYAALLPATCVAGSSVCIAQWALSALLLAPQSILLGATFPLVSSAVLRLSADQAGHDIASLYFVNSLGAVLGVLASAFLLIPAVGLPGALVAAGGVNIAIAVIAFFLSRQPPAPLAVAPLPAEASNEATSNTLTRVLLAVALLTGLSSFIYEIAWIRMLSLVLGASTHAFELMLASFILGLALGGLWVRGRVDRFPDPVRVLAYVQLAMGLAAVATIAVYNGAFDFMAWLLSAVAANDSGFVIFNLASVAICLLVMLPATFCAGMTLPLITYRLLRSREGERALGAVYAANTVGSIAGVIIAVHLLMSWLGVGRTLAVGAAIDVLLGVGLLAWRARTATGRRFEPRAAALVAAFVLVAATAGIDPARSASGVFRTGVARVAPSTEIVFHRDGKTATVDVMGSGGTRAIRTNGKPDAAMSMDPRRPPLPDEFTMTLLGLLPLGHQPQAKSAAIVGFGSGTTTSVLLASPRIASVDTIEIEPAMVDGARAFLPAVAAAYDDPRSRIVIDDAKSFFARGGARYDIIVSEPSNPWVSGVASLFTEEFYRRLALYLQDGGVLSQWVHTYEMDSATLASIIGALGRTFPDFVMYMPNDGDLVIVARKGGAAGRFDGAVLAFPALEPTLAKLRMQRVEAVASKVVASSATMGPYFATFGMPANSDFHPIVDQRASKTRFTKARVGDFGALIAAPVPMLEMLDGAAQPSAAPAETYPVVPAEAATRAAWAVYDGVMGRASAAPGEAVAHHGMGRLARAWSRGCQAWPFADAHATLLGVAGLVNTRLVPARAAEVWSELAQPGCRTGDAAPWLALFDAVARRDAAAMAREGRAALALTPAPGEAAEYALFAAATGLVCRGEAAAAAALLGEQTARVVRAGYGQAELRFLVALARDRDAAARAARCR